MYILYICIYIYYIYIKIKRFSSTFTKKEYKLNHKFICNNKCLIHILTCRKCMLLHDE